MTPEDRESLRALMAEDAEAEVTLTQSVIAAVLIVKHFVQDYWFIIGVVFFLFVGVLFYALAGVGSYLTIGGIR